MALCAVLRGYLRFVPDVVCTNGAHLSTEYSERFLAVDMHTAINGPVGDKGMVVICGADHHGFDIFLVHHAAPVPVSLRLREGFLRFLGT
jgi:hypothetical protein